MTTTSRTARIAPTTSQTLYGDDLYLNLTARDEGGIKDIIRKLQQEAKGAADYARYGKDLEMTVTEDEGVRMAVPVPVAGMPSKMQYRLRPVAHSQLATICGIPLVYYNRMLESDPKLLAQNVNRWIGDGRTEHLVRTAGEYVRAFLSTRYRPIDSVLVAARTIRPIQENGGSIIRAQLSEKRFYFAAVDNRWSSSVTTSPDNFTTPVGEEVLPLVTVTNSEVGHGGLTISIGTFTRICMNHMIWGEMFSKIHSGGRIPIAEGAYDFRSDETRNAQMEVDLRTVKDAVLAAFDQEKFNEILAAMKRAGETQVEDVPATMEALKKMSEVTDDELESILSEFAAPTVNVHSPTIYGLANAITYVAQSADPDREYELGKIAGNLIRQPELVAVRRSK